MQKDWLKFYKNKEAPTEPSSFAKFIFEKKIPGGTLVDLGCGNGRDTELLNHRYTAFGVDPFAISDQFANINNKDWKDTPLGNFDIVYSRFFLHAIPPWEISEILKRTPNYFCAECRAVGDKPKLYPEHDRFFVDPKWLFSELLNHNFEILYFAEGHGFAPYKDEDPLVIRVIAKKRNG